MPKIVVTQDMELTPGHRARLEQLGDVVYYDTKASTEAEWLERVKGANIICPGVHMIAECHTKLKDVFVSLPFVNISWVDQDVARKNNVVLSNSPGCNRYAVAEWVIMMLLAMTRQLPSYLNVESLPKDKNPAAARGLDGQTLAILGAGNIGQRVAEIAEALGMKVTFFRRGDDVYKTVAEANYVVSCLPATPQTSRLLDVKFFAAMKPGAFFAAISVGDIIDIDAMLEALDRGHLAGVAHDATVPGDVNDPLYQKLRQHPGVLATPHIAYNTDTSQSRSNDMMIENIEAWLAGRPINAIGAV